MLASWGGGGGGGGFFFLENFDNVYLRERAIHVTLFSFKMPDFLGDEFRYVRVPYNTRK